MFDSPLIVSVLSENRLLISNTSILFKYIFPRPKIILLLVLIFCIILKLLVLMRKVLIVVLILLISELKVVFKQKS